jgi:hypothetical protein
MHLLNGGQSLFSEKRKVGSTRYQSDDVAELLADRVDMGANLPPTLQVEPTLSNWAKSSRSGLQILVDRPSYAPNLYSGGSGD